MNVLIPWKHTCSVGVQAMDDQHAIIMDTLNELRLAVIRSDHRVPVSVLLDRIMEFTRLHFWSEEQLLEQNGYPGLEGHRLEHQRLLSELQNHLQRMHPGEPAQVNGLLTFLHRWFIDHVEGMDKEYGPWLNKHGMH